MSDPQRHHLRLQQLHQKAPFSRWYGATIQIGAGHAALRIPVRPMFFDPVASVHSAVFTRALNDAALFAANSLVADRLLRTVSFTTHVLQPLQAGVMRAEGHVAERAGALILAEARLLDGAGRLLATGNGVFTASAQPLDASIGYGDAADAAAAAAREAAA